MRGEGSHPGTIRMYAPGTAKCSTPATINKTPIISRPAVIPTSYANEKNGGPEITLRTAPYRCVLFTWTQ